MGTKSAWTPERRAQQAVNIRLTNPWEHSTGPTTPEGKLRSSQNARMPQHIVEAVAKQDDLMAGFLHLMGRKRRPRRPSFSN